VCSDSNKNEVIAGAGAGKCRVNGAFWWEDVK